MFILVPPAFSSKIKRSKSLMRTLTVGFDSSLYLATQQRTQQQKPVVAHGYGNDAASSFLMCLCSSLQVFSFADGELG